MKNLFKLKNHFTSWCEPKVKCFFKFVVFKITNRKDVVSNIYVDEFNELGGRCGNFSMTASIMFSQGSGLSLEKHILLETELFVPRLTSEMRRRMWCQYVVNWLW